MTYLDTIIDWHRRRAARDSRSTDELLADAHEEMSRQAGATSFAACATGLDTWFARSILGSPTLAVIAEIKRCSPSKGDIARDLVAADIAVEYEHAGAACLSVLTDQPHFCGSHDDLRDAKRATALPVLRKDFTVHEHDVIDARLMGADAVLLIVAALSDDELVRFHRLALQLGLAPLVEVHDDHELGRALDVGASLIGVNQRDLRSFNVDTERAGHMATLIPDDVIAVAESGIAGPTDARRCADSGYRAVLVGEHLVRHASRATALQDLRVALPS